MAVVDGLYAELKAQDARLRREGWILALAFIGSGAAFLGLAFLFSRFL